MRAWIRRTATGIASCVLASCSALTTVAPDAAPRAVRPPVAGTPFVDCRGIVHCHGWLSHDSKGTLEEISAACRDAAIDFVVMTDHQTDASIRDGVRGMVGDTLFVVGAEVRSVQKTTLLCFPLTAPLRRFQHPSLLAMEAKAQGALAFVCHGELWRLPFEVDGIGGAEIVNLHAGAMDENRLGTLGTGLFLTMRSLCERLARRDDKVFAAWDRALAVRHPFTPVGGDDAHANVRVFGPLGGTLGTYRELFLTLTTHALVERLDEAALVDAFANGRTYVSFDVFGDGTGFDFRLVGTGGDVHVGGASVVRGNGQALTVTTPTAGHIRVLRDGVEFAAIDGRELVVRDPAPGIWRAEVFTNGGDPWLFSSSIRVLAEAQEPAGPR